MMPTNTDRLKSYFELISRSRGGSDAVLDALSRQVGALRGVGAGLESLPAAEAGARASPLLRRAAASKPWPGAAISHVTNF